MILQKCTVQQYDFQCLFIETYAYTFIWTRNVCITGSRVLLEKPRAHQQLKISPSIFPNPSLHSRIHRSLTNVIIQNRTNPLHDPQYHFFNIHYKIILPSKFRSSKLFLFRQFSPQNTAYTGLFEIIVTVLTIFHTQNNWDRRISGFFYLVEQHSKFFYIPYRCSMCAPFVILQTSTR